MCLTLEYKWRRAFRHVSFHNKRSRPDHFHWAIDNETLHTRTHWRSRVSATQTYIVLTRDASDTTDLEQLSRLLFWIMHIKNLIPWGRKNCSFVPKSRLFLLRRCFHMINSSYRIMLCFLAEPLLLYYIFPIILLLKEAYILI